MKKTRSGLVRHIVTKIGIKTNEVMCIIVINGDEIPCEKELVKELLKILYLKNCKMQVLILLNIQLIN